MSEEKQPAKETRQSEGPGGTELRIALAMRGGVSLAVWIGGAMAELDLARRAMLMDPIEPPAWDPGASARAEAYAALIRAKGYTGLKIDVLAGASAGGLNAVIYGFAQSVGTDLTWLREVWRKNGDIWGLFHPAWRAAEPFRTEALLQGDARFYDLIYQELTSVARMTRDTLPPTDYLTVDLAATLQTGPPLPATDGGDDLRPRTAHFRFRRTPASAGGPFNDMPASLVKDASEDDQNVRQLTAQLAYAARSTSSFPGAFEPATVVSWTPRGPERDRARGDVAPENMSAVFSEAWTDSEAAFYVMDGGVFDNIPIGRALHSIADAPASTPTERVLIYLDPSPPTRSAAATPVTERLHKSEDQKPEKTMRAALVRSALTAMRYKQTVESSTDDLAELRRLHTSRDDVQTRRQLFIDALPGVLDLDLDLDLDPDRTVRAGRYKDFRCVTAANRLIDLMVTPGTGFLRSLVPPPQITTALSEAEAPQVRAELEQALKSRVGSARAALEADDTALAAVAELFISWVSALQKEGSAGNTGAATSFATKLATSKAALYRVRAAALFVRDRRETEAVSCALSLDPPETQIPYGEIAGVLWPASETFSPSTGTAPAGQAETTEDEAAWPTFSLPDASSGISSSDVESRFWERLEGIEPKSAGDAAEDDLIVAGWKFLREVLNSLRPPPPTPPPEGDEPSAVPVNPILEKLGCQDLTMADLQSIGVGASLAVGVTMSPAVPRFYPFTGDQLPLDASSLPNVAAEGRAMALDGAIAARAGKVRSDVINAQSKLAGNQLANFAGFLSAEWRDHDWRWGAADAGAALIGMLETLPATPGPDTQPSPSEAAEAAEAAKDGVKLLYQDLNKRKYRLSDLTPKRRFALGTRTLLGAQRALWPLTPKANAPARTSQFKSAPTVAAMMVARPLLVLLPLVLRPAILAAALTTVVLSEYSGVRAADFSAEQKAAEDGIFVIVAASPAFSIVIIVLAIASAVLSVFSLRNLKQRWKGLRDANGLDNESAVITNSVIKRIGCGQKALLLEVVALLILVTLATFTDSGGDALNSLTRFSLVTALILLLAVNGLRGPYKATAVPRHESGEEGTDKDEPKWDRRGCAAWVFWSAVTLVWVLPAKPPFGASHEFREAIATAISVGVLVWAVHHYWAKNLWPGTMGAFSALLVACGSYWLQPFLTRALDPDSASKLSNSCRLAIDLLLPLVVVGVVFVVALVTKKLAAGKRPDTQESSVPLTRAPDVPDPNAPTLKEYAFTTGGLVLLLVVTLAGSLGLYVSWDWLQVIPLSLVLGSSAAAATTLVAPIEETLNDP